MLKSVAQVDLDRIQNARNDLLAHPVLRKDALTSLEDIRTFMSHHIYPVWDFMSLVKFLQNVMTPTNSPWVPRPEFKTGLVRHINAIVLDEESDITPEDDVFMSHYELYMSAMDEVGCDTSAARTFINRIGVDGVEAAMAGAQNVPAPSLEFMDKTFSIIATGEAHRVAAAFAFGRETIIPDMFRHLLKQLDMGAANAPYFHFYLARHIEVDGEQHGQASLDLVEAFCAGDPKKIAEAEETAISSIQARIKLWDGVGEALGLLS